MIPEQLTLLANGRRRRYTKKAVTKKFAKAKPIKQQYKKLGLNSITCPVCLEHISVGEVSSTICGHIFCTGCIRESLTVKKSCPKCQRYLRCSSYHPLFLDVHSDAPSPKKEVTRTAI